jgi:hypothetical protein
MENGTPLHQKCRIHSDVDITLIKDPVTGSITGVGCKFEKGSPYHTCRYDNGPSMTCCYVKDPSC